MVSTMDSQQIKEALAADPYTTDEALIKATEANAELRQYQQEMQQLHDEMVAAIQIHTARQLTSTWNSSNITKQGKQEQGLEHVG